MIFDSIELNGNCYLDIGFFRLTGPRPKKSILHLHHYLEISIVKSGHAHYAIGDKDFDMNKGDVFIINNTEIHGIYLKENETIDNLVIHFSPRFIWSSNTLDLRYLAVFFERNESFSNKINKDNPSTKRIQELFHDLEKEFKEKKPEYFLMVKVKLLNILTLLLRHYNYTVIPTTTVSKDLQIHSIDIVTEYIDTNFCEQIPISELGEIAHMHPSYLSSVFKKYHGITPKEYIIRKRITHAINYLKTSNKTVLDIASLSGFNNMTNFHKTFKKITGVTPSFYRKNTSISGYKY